MHKYQADFEAKSFGRTNAAMDTTEIAVVNNPEGLSIKTALFGNKAKLLPVRASPPLRDGCGANMGDSSNSLTLAEASTHPLRRRSR